MPRFTAADSNRCVDSGRPTRIAWSIRVGCRQSLSIQVGGLESLCRFRSADRLESLCRFGAASSNRVSVLPVPRPRPSISPPLPASPQSPPLIFLTLISWFVLLLLYGFLGPVRSFSLATVISIRSGSVASPASVSGPMDGPLSNVGFGLGFLEQHH